MLDLLAQFPIVDEDAPIRQLHDEAAELSRVMAFEHGYAAAGPPTFQLLELPLGMYVQCRFPVQEIEFGGGQGGK